MEKFKLIEKLSEKKTVNGTTSYRYYEIIECVDCGHQIKITAGDKRRKKSCKECDLKKYKEDFVGYENDLYKVVEFTEQKGKKLFYRVKCKRCNNFCVMRKDSIINSSNKSCINCKGNGRKPTTDVAINVFMSIYKTGAKERGLEWSISNEEFKEITSKNCFYCNSEPIIQKSLERYYHESISERILLNGIDRVDSTLGYTFDNCVACCTMCNRMKLDYTKNDFLNHISKIFKFSIKSSTTIENTSNKDGSE